MLPNLEKTIPELPSFRATAGKVASDLQSCRSVVLVYPEGMDPAWIVDPVRLALFNAGTSYRELLIDGSNGEKNCSKEMAEKLGLVDYSGYTPETPSALMAAPELPDAVILKFAGKPDPGRVYDWVRFIEKWASTAHGKANAGRFSTAVFLAVPGNIEAVASLSSDLYLSTRYMWGMPSLLETRLLCRQLWEGRGDGHLDLWHEYVFASLAMGDLHLLAHLWEHGRDSQQDIDRHVLDYAKTKNWEINGEKLKDMVGDNRCPKNGDRVMPPRSVFPCWAEGMVGFVPEKGIFIQTAALALMGMWDEIHHRIWTGQAEFLLPLLDAARLEICDRLTKWFGKSWPTAWTSPDSPIELELVKKNPRSCQWGHLARVCGSAGKLKKKTDFLKAVERLRFVRNEIAHYRPISDRNFLKLSREMDNLDSN